MPMRLLPEDRDLWRTTVVRLYNRDKMTIRDIAFECDLSYCLTRTLLIEANVKMRPSGGGRRQR